MATEMKDVDDGPTRLSCGPRPQPGYLDTHFPGLGKQFSREPLAAPREPAPHLRSRRKRSQPASCLINAIPVCLHHVFAVRENGIP